MSKFKFRFGSLIVIINVYILGHILVFCQRLYFRPHVKDNSRRVFLQKKKKAIFDGEGWQCWWWWNRWWRCWWRYCDDNRDNDGDNVGLIFKGLYKQESDNSYNAFEKDIAVVHFFFQVVIIWLIFIRMMVMVMHTCFIIVKVWSLFSGTDCVPIPESSSDDLGRLHLTNGRWEDKKKTKEDKKTKIKKKIFFNN